MLLDCVPSPLPDEHAASVYYRAFLFSPVRTIELYFEYVLGTRFYGSPYNFWVPAYGDLAMSLTNSLGVASFIKSYTNVGEYGPFLPLELESSGSVADVLDKLSITKFKYRVHVQTDRHWRYCPSCAAEDYKTFGTTYYHVSHQRYYQRTCTRHSMLLEVHKCERGYFELPPNDTAGQSAPVDIIEFDHLLAELVATIRRYGNRGAFYQLIKHLRSTLGWQDTVVYTGAYRSHLNLYQKNLTHYFNSTPIQYYFNFPSLHSNSSQYLSQIGVANLLNINSHLHPLYYLWVIASMLTPFNEYSTKHLIQLPSSVKAILEKTIT